MTDRTDREAMLERLRSANPLPDHDAVDAEELGLFVSYFKERKGDMHPTPATEPTNPAKPPKRPWYRQPVTIFASAVIVTILAVTPLLLLRSTGSVVVVDEPVVSTTLTPVVSTTLTPVVSTTIPAAPATTIPVVDAWQRVGADVMDPVVGLFDITVADSRLVALGFDPGDDYRQDGVVFVSDNGVDWTRLAADDPALTTGTVLIYGVAEGGPGLVAGGLSCEDAEFPCLAGPYPTVWTSTDGTAWTRTVVEQGVDFGAINDVLVTDHGIIAVGGFTEPTPEGGITSSGVVWLSTDGTDWSRVWQGAGVPVAEFGSGPGPEVLALGPDGLIVGAGWAFNDSGEGVAAVWVSSNGTDWARVDPESVEFASDTGHDAIISDIVWGPAGFVAIGGDGSRAAVWTSTDGSAWTRIDTTQAPIVSAAPLSAIAALDNGYVAAGPDGNAELVTLWTSTDGISWDRVQVLDEGIARAIVSTDGGIAIAGQVIENGGTDVADYRAGIWIGPLFDPEAPPPDPGPPPEPAPEEPVSGVAALEEGVSCEDIAAQEFTYAEAVSHWMRYDMPTDLDPDGNGVPCEASYSTTNVAGVFGEPGALSVRLVSDLPAQLFEASGSAVDEGLVCASGTTEFTDDGTPPKHAGASGRWEDVYTCDDGSGTFTIGADGFISVDGLNYGVWDIGSGTGSYETLAGGGGVFTGPTGPGTWSDDLIGRVTSGANEN